LGKKRGHGATRARPAAPSRAYAPNAAAPVPADLLIATGVKAQRTGDIAGAEAAFRQTLAADPTEPRAVQYLGAILADRNEIDAAIDVFESAVERVGEPNEENLGFYNNYANALRRAERFGSAEKILRELVKASPGEWQPWHNLGQTLRDLERFDEAAAAMRRAVMLEPAFGPNHGVLGEVLFKLGRLHSADAALRRCLELGWRSDANIWTTIGASYNFNDKLTFDVSYAHLFPKSTRIALTPGNPSYSAASGPLVGKVDARVDIVSVGLRYRWDDVAKTIPVTTPIVRKY